MAISVGSSSLTFHPLTYVDDDDGVVIGRRDIDSYGMFPPDGAELVRTLAAGTHPAAAAQWYEEKYGESVDIDDFIDTLRDLELIRADDSEEVAVEPPRWQQLGRWAFSLPACVVYASLVTAGIITWVAQPELAPSREHVFFTEYQSLVVLVLLVGQIPLVLLHETFHLLAGRRLGLRTSMSVGRRLYFIVVETTMDGLVSVPRRSRYLPMLAGLIADVVVVASLTLVAAATADSAPLASRLALAFVYTTLFRVGWQLLFFLRTDVYYLVTTVHGCVDLYSTTRALLANRVNAALGRHDRLVDESSFHPRDRRVARWYLPLMLTGYAMLIGALAYIVLPLVWEFLGEAVHVVSSTDAGDAHFWDSGAVLTLVVVQLAVALWLFVRSRQPQGESTPKPS